jgi:hypothetical protein
MSYSITHRYGNMDPEPPITVLPSLLAELRERPEDTEHGSVALTHESEWCMSVSYGGHVIFENLESGGERHLAGVSDAQILLMWEDLAAGRIAKLQELPWVPGYE